MNGFSERSTMDDLDERDEELLDEQVQEAELPNVSANNVGSQPSTPRKENTARQHKRFSLPAVALQTSPVTTRLSSDGGSKAHAHSFSLVLGQGVSHQSDLGAGERSPTHTPF